MFNRAELKQLAKSQLKGKSGSGVVFTLVYLLICIGLGVLQLIPVIGYIASVLLTLPLAVGVVIAFVNFVKKGNELEISDMFKGFNNFGKSLGIVLWVGLWTILWMLLFFIPGIIKSLAYSQTLFIYADNPNVKVKDALKLSIKMTNGHKGKIFVMGLSFIGWMLLGCITFGIYFLWLMPYMYTTYTNMFYKLKEMSIQNGVCTAAEFEGTAPATPATPVAQ